MVHDLAEWRKVRAKCLWRDVQMESKLAHNSLERLRKLEAPSIRESGVIQGIDLKVFMQSSWILRAHSYQAK